MQKCRLTARFLNALARRQPPQQRYEVMDTDVPGFGVRISEKGRLTFILVARYPASSNPTRRALGDVGALSLEEARTMARAWLSLIRKGIDPKVQASADRRSEIDRSQNSFGKVSEEYGAFVVDRLRRSADVRAHLKVFREAFGATPIDSVSPRDILSAIDAKVREGKSAQAHAMFATIRRLFNWAIARGVYGLERSPCDRLKPSDLIGPHHVRTRVLADREIQAVWSAAGQLGYPFGPLVQMLLLTGQRKNEVAQASWDEFDFDRMLWTIPASRMKSDVTHTLPITADLEELLTGLPTFGRRGFVFSTTFGRRPVSGFSKAKKRLDQLVAIELGSPPAVFVLHDLRRTMRTGLSALPVADLVRELVIAHRKPGLHRVYDQFAYLDEKRLALELWSDRLRNTLTTPKENVIPFRAAG